MTTMSVGIIGFSAQEERKFHKIFKLSQQYERSYELANLTNTESVDLLIVKKSDAIDLQLQTYQKLIKNQSLPFVSVGREPVANRDIYYRGILVPSRVLPLLDTIEIQLVTTAVDKSEEQAVIVEKNLPVLETIEQEVDLHVLVVDDSQMMQKTVQLELNKTTTPLAVDFADNGEMALEKVKQKKYDFIFLDVMMPGMDGFETCSQIRKLEGMAKTPIIMLTSKTSALDEVKGLMAGCTTYLTKPFEHDEFHKMLERIMHWVKEFNEKK